MAPDANGVMRNLSRAIYALPTDTGTPRAWCISPIYADTGRGYGQDRTSATCLTNELVYAVATALTDAEQGLIYKNRNTGSCLISFATSSKLIPCPR